MSAGRDSGRHALCGTAGPVCAFLVVVFLAVPATGQGLGRFFSTPEERARLDEIRANRDLIEPDPEPATQAAPQAPVVEQLSIEGLVIRSGGTGSAWVNGRPVFDGWTTREGVRVDAAPAGRSGGVKITLPSGADTIDLKPGQSIDVETGVVVEAYERKGLANGPSAFGSTAVDDNAKPEAAESGEDGG